MRNQRFKSLLMAVSFAIAGPTIVLLASGLKATRATPDGLHRCSSLPAGSATPLAATQAGSAPVQYVERDGLTEVIDGHSGQVIAQIPAAGELAYNRCNNRVLIAAGAQGIFIVDGKTQQIMGHIPYLLQAAPNGATVDLNVYAVGAASNSITDDYLIKVREPHYAHGGYWHSDDIRFFDNTTLAINSAFFPGYDGKYAFDPLNAVYDPL